jgi:hypothetical protein
MTSRRPIRAASAAGARGRAHHSLAPAHLSEATAAATVAVVVGGIALVITGIGMTAMALTLPARYGADPPPDVGALTLLPTLGGVALMILGGLLASGGVGVLVRARRARVATGALAAITALLAALGVVLVMAVPPRDVVLAVGLTVAALVFGAASILLLRPRR